MIAPMACSRMPKCSTRPYGPPGNALDCRSVGRKLGSPSGVVLLDSARSAEPPHSSGIFGVIALITLPDAARVAMPLGSAGQLGRSLSQPGVSSSATSRSYSALPSGFAAAQVSKLDCQSSWACRPRSASSRVWAITSSATSNVCSGSKPSTFLVAATSSAPSAEPWDLPVPCSFGAGQRDDRPELDEARLVGDPPRRLDGVVQGRDVLLVVGVAVGPVDRLHVPAVRGVAGRDVLGQGDVGVVLDGDPVAVVDQRQVAQPLGGAEGGCLAADPLLDVAVGGQAVDMVIERGLARGGVRVEQSALAACRHGHPDGVGDALAQRTGGDLHALGVPVLRVAGGLRAPGPQRLEVVELQAEAAEVELDVQGQAGVSAGEHEPVPARPVGVARVVPHHLLEQQVGHRGQAHRGAGVAVADLLHGVGGEHPDGVDGLRVEIGPAVRDRSYGRGGGAWVSVTALRSFQGGANMVVRRARQTEPIGVVPGEVQGVVG